MWGVPLLAAMLGGLSAMRQVLLPDENQYIYTRKLLISRTTADSNRSPRSLNSQLQNLITAKKSSLPGAKDCKLIWQALCSFFIRTSRIHSISKFLVLAEWTKEEPQWTIEFFKVHQRLWSLLKQGANDSGYDGVGGGRDVQCTECSLWERFSI